MPAFAWICSHGVLATPTGVEQCPPTPLASSLPTMDVAPMGVCLWSHTSPRFSWEDDEAAVPLVLALEGPAAQVLLNLAPVDQL